MSLPIDAPLRDRIQAALVKCDLNKICENWGLPPSSEGSGAGFEHLLDCVAKEMDPTGELDRYCRRPLCRICKGEGEIEAYEMYHFCKTCSGKGRIDP